MAGAVVPQAEAVVPREPPVRPMAFDFRRFAIAITGFCTFLNLYAPQALLPELSREFGVGPAEISTMITAGTLAIALTAPFTGAISDVLGRKNMYRIYLGVGALLYLTIDLTSNSNKVVFLLCSMLILGCSAPRDDRADIVREALRHHIREYEAIQRRASGLPGIVFVGTCAPLGRGPIENVDADLLTTLRSDLFKIRRVTRAEIRRLGPGPDFITDKETNERGIRILAAPPELRGETATISVLRHEPRKSRIISAVSPAAMAPSLSTPSTAARTKTIAPPSSRRCSPARARSSTCSTGMASPSTATPTSRCPTPSTPTRASRSRAPALDNPPGAGYILTCTAGWSSPGRTGTAPGRRAYPRPKWPS